MGKVKRFLVLIGVLLISLGVLVFINGHNKYEQAIEIVSIEEKVKEIRNKDSFYQIEDIPKFYIDAVVSVEDRRFYKHNGFDIIGVLRAVVTDIKTMSLKEGGSTITQQLAKNMYFPIDSTLERKIAEIFLALELEKILDKDEILELYFNTIYYGSGYYSIKDASLGYFNKLPKDMDEYESSLLAGVPNAPSVYSPKNNLSLTHKRQKKVLSSMKSCKIIDSDKMEEILKIQQERTN